MKKRRANSQASMGGFTLIELAIVLAVMAMIAVYATPRYMEQLNQKRAILTAQETQSFLDAARSYRMQNGSWPGQASSCANAKSVLESTSPPTLPASAQPTSTTRQLPQLAMQTRSRSPKALLKTGMV